MMKRLYILFYLFVLGLNSSLASEATGTIINNNSTVSDTISGSIANVTVNSITLSTDTPSVSVSVNSNGIINLNIPTNVSSPVLDLSMIVSGNHATLPATVITTGNVNSILMNINIPSGTTITAATSSWDGKIYLPRISNTNITAQPATGNSLTVTSAIEMGSPLFRLYFNNAVRVVFGGLANNYIGYMNGSSFIPINTSCAVDSQSWSDANLSSGGECYILQGSNLILWTKHFTTFGTYTQQPVIVPSVGGGSGGGGGYVYTPYSNPVNNNLNSTSTLGINSTSTNAASNSIKVMGFTFKKVIKRGSKGIDVSELQNFLISKKFLAANLFTLSNPMGTFGVATEKSLRAYQKSLTLEQTGALGPKTMEAINSDYDIKVNSNVNGPTSGTSSNTISKNSNLNMVRADDIRNNIEMYKDLKVGDEGDRVKALQKILINKGLLWTNATGIYGDGTAGAWRDYKKLLKK